MSLDHYYCMTFWIGILRINGEEGGREKGEEGGRERGEKGGRGGVTVSLPLQQQVLGLSLHDHV